MAGLGIAGGFGAGAGADYLLSLVRQRLQEQEVEDRRKQDAAELQARTQEAAARRAGDDSDRALREKVFAGQSADREATNARIAAADAEHADDRAADNVRAQAEQTQPGTMLDAAAAAPFRKYAPTTVETARLDPGGAANPQDNFTSGTQPLPPTGQVRFKGTAVQMAKRDAAEQAEADKKATREKPLEVSAGAVVYDPVTKQPIYSAPRAPKDTSASDNARLDRSYQYNATQLQSLRKPYEDAGQRLQRLNETLAKGSPQADALVAPELLTVMAGGPGSGLRMNEAEIQRIVGGRSQWENLRAAIQHWSLDPASANSITPEQRKQITDLVGAVNQRIQKSMNVLDQAGDELVNAGDVTAHRQTIAKTRKALSGINGGGPDADAGGGGTAGGPAPGDRRIVGGVLAEWDGKGWLPAKR